MATLSLLIVFLIPGLPVLLPLLFLVTRSNRFSGKYRGCWLGLVAVFTVISLVFFIFIMSMPFYSHVSHQPPKGGGPEAGFDNLEKGMYFLLFLLTVIVPSFTGLFILGVFPPKSYSRKKQLAIKAIVPIGVVLMALVMSLKRDAYLKDRREYRNPPRQSAFEHLRS